MHKIVAMTLESNLHRVKKSIIEKPSGLNKASAQFNQFNDLLCKAQSRKILPQQ
jgi:hypothetical protein